MESTMRDALEVILTWDGNAQRQELYARAQEVHVGEAAGADFMLPREVLAEDFVLAAADAGAWTLNVPGGAVAYLEKDGEAVDLTAVPSDAACTRRIALAPGMRAIVELGAFAFHVRPTDAPRVSAGPVAFDLRSWGFVLGSVAFHGLMLGMFLLMPPHASAISTDLSGAQRDYLQYHLAALVPPEPEVIPPPETGDGPQGGAEGQPHEGDRGTAGPRNPRPTGGGSVRRQGQDNATQIPRESVQDMGALGVLRRMLGEYSPISSPFGREQALAGDATDRWGLPDLTDGIGNGTWGFDTNGPGHGTCPPGATNCAQGTVGVGDGDMIGTGTCTQAQFAEIAGRAGRAAAVAQCRGDGPSIGASLRNGDRHARVPSLRPGVADVGPGGLSREQIRRTVQRHLPEIRHCYEQGLVSNPELAGRVSVAFMITTSGTVQSAVVTGNTTHNANLSGCVSQAVRRWEFPQSPGATFVREYPFRMEQN